VSKPAIALATAGNPSPQGGGEQAEFAAPAFVNSTGIDSPAMVPTATPPLGAPAEGDPASIVQRLQSAVARVLPAIEATIARLAAGPQHPREMEQAGRALSSLTRTLRELNALLSQHIAQAEQKAVDIDAFREELARRINEFCAAEAAANDEAKAEEL
jgi:phospholipase/lecithinase/hemolysin